MTISDHTSIGLIKLICGILLFSTHFLFAQQDTSLSLPVEDPVPFFFNDPDESIPIGYGYQYSRERTGAITTLSCENFNKGIISDPLLLLQGRMAGWQVYNRGGDPNLTSISRTRGLSAVSNRQPLVVVDGIAGASLQNLDPNDIASITLLKDGSAQAIYGIRASNGVLMISTKESTYTTDTLTISYQTQLGYSSPYPGIAITTADEFRALGGVDLGASTNWLDEVQRNGSSQTHGLALQGRKADINYRFSGNYRNVEGVLRKSGFEQLNVRGTISGEFLKERLSINLSAAYTDRTSELGFNEAFRYANSFNPTIPLLAQDAPFPYNTEEFGGFFETKGLFDSFNPKALVDLNDRNATLQAVTTAALLRYDISPALSFNFRYAYQHQFANERAFYSPQSLFRGNAYSPFLDRRGRADLSDIEDKFSSYEWYGNYQTTLGSTKIGLTLGGAYQDGSHLDNYLQLEGFSNKDLIETRNIGDYAKWENEAFYTDTINNGWSDKLSAFFGRAHFNIKDKLFLNASLRYEGASKLGENNRWGVFPSLGMALDLKKWWNIDAVDQLRLRSSYGVTGMVPLKGGLSQEKIVIRGDGINPPFEDLEQAANPMLGWEQKNEFNLGVDLAFYGINFSLDWYSRSMKDIITEGFLEVPFFPAQYINQDELTSTGIDLGIEAGLLNRPHYGYTMGVVFSTNQVKYSKLKFDNTFAVTPGGAIEKPIITIREGDEVGNIVAPFFVRADISGNPVFADVNNDGQVLVGTESVFAETGDFALVGNGLPDYELGWTHQLHFRGWQLAALFRGAFGHSLVNMNRLHFEQGPAFISVNYNRVNTELAVDNLQVSRYSSLYVEDASFLKLDNLSLAKQFRIGKSGKQLTISLTGQNLLVFTDYTGADPEPVLADLGATTFGSFQRNVNEGYPFAPGIDNLNYYLPARTYVLGLRLAL
jgi:iron complex outermembrane receptor protein